MDIWTERLERRHLPLAERWIGREDGALTPNDLPAEAEGLEAWYEACRAQEDRLDCLALVYETPVGLAGLRRHGREERTAELWLLLGEMNYNPLRTATYVTLRMLDRAFSEPEFGRVCVRVREDREWYTEALERMGFVRTDARGGMLSLCVEKDVFLNRKYLF